MEKEENVLTKELNEFRINSSDSLTSTLATPNEYEPEDIIEDDFFWLDNRKQKTKIDLYKFIEHRPINFFLQLINDYTNACRSSIGVADTINVIINGIESQHNTTNVENVSATLNNEIFLICIMLPLGIIGTITDRLQNIKSDYVQGFRHIWKVLIPVKLAPAFLEPTIQNFISFYKIKITRDAISVAAIFPSFILGFLYGLHIMEDNKFFKKYENFLIKHPYLNKVSAYISLPSTVALDLIFGGSKVSVLSQQIIKLFLKPARWSWSNSESFTSSSIEQHQEDYEKYYNHFFYLHFAFLVAGGIGLAGSRLSQKYVNRNSNKFFLLKMIEKCYPSLGAIGLFITFYNEALDRRIVGEWTECRSGSCEHGYQYNNQYDSWFFDTQKVFWSLLPILPTIILLFQLYKLPVKPILKAIENYLITSYQQAKSKIWREERQPLLSRADRWNHEINSSSGALIGKIGINSTNEKYLQRNQIDDEEAANIDNISSKLGFY